MALSPILPNTPDPYLPNKPLGLPPTSDQNAVERVMGNISEGISGAIERGISNAMNAITDRIGAWFSDKLHSFLVFLPQLVTVCFVCYLSYLGFRIFIMPDNKKLDFQDCISNIYTVTFVYVIFRLFWKVVFKIS